MILNVKLITGESLTFTVEKETVVIGRSGQCDVVIPHEAVSRKHCQIDYYDGDLYVTDLGSTAGVLLDGQKITPDKKVKFQSFLTLSFGAVQTLNVELDEEKTSVRENPFTTTLQVKEARPKPSKIIAAQKAPEPVKKPGLADDPKELPMSNFVVLCVMVVLGFAFFIFREDIMGLLE